MTTDVNGFRWTDLSHGDDYILKERSYGCLFADENEESLRSTDRWLDIGAHIGSFAVPAAQRVDFVLAVEPEPLNFQHLQENLVLNDSQNVHPVRAAVVSGLDRKVELGIGRTFTYTHKVGRTRGREHIWVDSVNINDLVREHAINKIKMDCEGLEAELLICLDYTPIDEIILEWHFTLIPDPSWNSLRAALDRFRYEGFDIIRTPTDMAKPTKRWTAIIWTKRS